MSTRSFRLTPDAYRRICGIALALLALIVVTGAARGLGAAMAKRLATHHTKLGLIDLEKTSLEATAAACKEAGAEVATYGADVSKENNVEAVFDQVVADLGSLHGLINNAGITRDNLAMRMKDDEWDQVIRINLEASFRLMRASARPMMKAKGGRIISITSVVGHTGNPGQMNYTAAKGGLTAMSKSLAQELASRNITVNCVAPGFIRTAMTDALNDDQKGAINSRIPMGRMGEGEEIGAAVAYLASDEAAYVTGQTLHVNGGMAMMG